MIRKLLTRFDNWVRPWLCSKLGHDFTAAMAFADAAICSRCAKYVLVAPTHPNCRCIPTPVWLDHDQA
jgi:hypothetical protein